MASAVASHGNTAVTPSSMKSDFRHWHINLAVALVIGISYLAITFDPHYEPFHYDELLFIQAMDSHTLAFFPGYIGFLFAGNLLRHMLSPGASLQLVSALFGALAVVSFWLWARSLRLSASLCVLSALVFGTSVFQLYYSSVGTTYTVEASTYLAAGYFCAASVRKPRLLYLGALVIALAGAFRQSTPAFLLPLLLYSCWKIRNFKPLLVAGLVSLVWIVPTVEGFGGLMHFPRAAAAQIDGAVLPSTALRSLELTAVNTMRFTIYLFYGAHLMMFLGLLRVRMFELLWIGPATLFYAFFYVAWPGYTLGILAVLMLLGVTSTAQFRRPVALTILSLVCIINCFQFFAARPISDPNSTASAIVSTYAFQFSRVGIRQKYQVRLRDLLEQTNVRQDGVPNELSH